SQHIVHRLTSEIWSNEKTDRHTRKGLTVLFYWISTITFLSSFEAAALTTERIAFAILPCLPMTLPISAAATFSSITISSSFCVSVTTTSSGLSTSAFAITSTNSFISPPHTLFLLNTGDL